MGKEVHVGRPSKYPEEFRSEAVRLLGQSDCSVAQVARDLGVNAETVRTLVRADEVETGERVGFSKSERAELAELRRRVKRLEQEKEILGKAAAFVAREGKVISDDYADPPGNNFVGSSGEFSRAEPPIPADAVSGETILVGLTFDAKISNGDWPMLGDAPIREDVPLPAYKVAIGHPEKIEIEAYSGSRSRPATASELGTAPLSQRLFSA
jgi:transposase